MVYCWFTVCMARHLYVYDIDGMNWNDMRGCLKFDYQKYLVVT